MSKFVCVNDMSKSEIKREIEKLDKEISEQSQNYTCATFFGHVRAGGFNPTANYVKYSMKELKERRDMLQSHLDNLLRCF